MWMPMYPFPYGPPPTGKTEDPIRIMKRWKKFLKGEEDEDKKKKDKDKKKGESFDALLQIASVLFVSTFLVGPIVYTIWHLATK